MGARRVARRTSRRVARRRYAHGGVAGRRPRPRSGGGQCTRLASGLSRRAGCSYGLSSGWSGRRCREPPAGCRADRSARARPPLAAGEAWPDRPDAPPGLRRRFARPRFVADRRERARCSETRRVSLVVREPRLRAGRPIGVMRARPRRGRVSRPLAVPSRRGCRGGSQGERDERAVQGQDQRRHPRLGAGLVAVRAAEGARGRAERGLRRCSTTSASRRWRATAGRSRRRTSTGSSATVCATRSGTRRRCARRRARAC